MELIFAAIGLAMLVGYAMLLWVGMAPESALGFIAGGGLVVGLLSRIAIGVMTSPDAPAPPAEPVVNPIDGVPRADPGPGPEGTSRTPSGERV